MKIAGADFLSAHGDTWIARRAPEFSVLNVHAREIPAPASCIFPELGDHELLAPNRFYKLLIAVRAAVGRIFGWDRGMKRHGAEPLEVGKHYAFFLIEHVNVPRELSMSARNRLTEALMGWVLEESAGRTRVFNVTCANFSRWQGQLYWGIIGPFHDALIEVSLKSLARRMRRLRPSDKNRSANLSGEQARARAAGVGAFGCYNSRFLMSRTTQEGPRVTPEVSARYEAVIGLEVHAQLETVTKAFCGCSTRFGDAPNSNTCPVCLGLPGALPVLNAKALELALRASLALHCKVHERSRFARKNYFYPDLPKGYQISMYELPLATAGWLDVELGEREGGAKRIGVTRLHMEEDAAKNLHEGFPDSDRWSYIDFNRGGVPLVEIVSEPDIRTPAEAYSYLTTLKQVLEYTDVSDCNMEEGSLRCDANVSVRLRGAEKFGTKVEVKNLNSFRYLSHTLEYEIERQIGVLESGGRIAQETRLWNVAAGRTEAMRSKEMAHDYRYFPDPDLLPVTVLGAAVEKVRAGMPELPDLKRSRFWREYGLTAYDAGVLTATQALADYFEAVVRAGAPAKLAANWISTELLRRLNDSGKEIAECPVAAGALAELVKKIEGGEITAASGKKVFAQMFDTGKRAGEIIAADGMAQISDEGAIEKIARDVVAKNADNAAKYRAGNEGVFKFFVGQVMRETRGQANPQLVNDILKRVLAQS